MADLKDYSPLPPAPFTEAMEWDGEWNEQDGSQERGPEACASSKTQGVAQVQGHEGVLNDAH